MLSDAIGSLSGDATFDITRVGPVTYVHGRATQSPGIIVTVHGLVRPASPKDLLRLPEGERSTDRISIWSLEELRTADAQTMVPGDRVPYKGRTYEVESVERSDDLGGFWKSMARKVEL